MKKHELLEDDHIYLNKLPSWLPGSIKKTISHLHSFEDENWEAVEAKVVLKISKDKYLKMSFSIQGREDELD